MKNNYKIRTIILEENSHIKNRLNTLFYKDERFEIVGIISSVSRLDSLMKRHSPELLLLNGNSSTRDIDILKEEIKKEYPEIQMDSLYRVLEEKYCRSIVDFSDFYKSVIDEQLLMDSKTTFKERSQESELKKTKKQACRRRYLSRISDLLLLIGVPASLLGYKFMREAILITLEKPKFLSGITKYIYPEVAKTYNTTVQCVERSIRHAIDLTWTRGRVHKINELYEIEILDEYVKPTNGELISIIADKVKLEVTFEV